MGEGLNDQGQPGGYPDTDQADYNQFKQFAFHVNLKFFNSRVRCINIAKDGCLY